MQYAAFLSTFALLWLTGLMPGPGAATARVVVANPSADQARVAADPAAVGTLSRFRETGTENARAAVVAAERQGLIRRLANGAAAERVEGTPEAPDAYIAIRVLEGELAGRVVYIARAEIVR